MELAHNLTLNEEVVKSLPDNKKDVFIFEWLQFLDKVLSALNGADVKQSQKTLTSQLTALLTKSPGPPTRYLIAKCLATLFTIGNTNELFNTIDKCNDIIKNKDDSPSYLPNKLAAITTIGVLYERLGRMVGRSYEETVGHLMRSLKNSESQGRYEVMKTLERIVAGLGTAGKNIHKEIYKAALKLLVDNNMNVRCSTSKCLKALIFEAQFVLQTEVDTLVATCIRALDGSNYDVRCHIAQLLAVLLAECLKAKNVAGSKAKKYDVKEVLGLLASGFIKAGKGSSAVEMVRGASAINREIRVGITHAYNEFIKLMGAQWLEKNLPFVVDHVVTLAANPRTTHTHIDAVYARKCIVFIIASSVQGMLGEKAQVNAAEELSKVIAREMQLMGAEANTDSPHQSVISATQHVLVCCLQELGGIVTSLSTTTTQLIGDSKTDIVKPVMSVLTHPSPAARLAAAWCLRSIAIAVPALLTPLLEKSMENLDKMKSTGDALNGYSFAIASLLGAVSKCPLGIPYSIGKKVFNIAEELLRSAAQSSRMSLPRIQSAWLIISALMTLGSSVVRPCLPTLLQLWRNTFPRSVKELDAENSKGDAFTWQVALDGRAGALASILSFVRRCPELLTSETTKRILIPVECAFILLQKMPSIVKEHGTHLKASAAMLRLRLYDILCGLPPESYVGAYKHLFRELVAEFTLTENPANTSTSLLRDMCHVDDSVILGAWLQETDHKDIEDQLQPNSAAGSGALEHDSSYLYSSSDNMDPGPLPLGVAVIDSSVRLYGMLFARVSDKHKLQMLQHFKECMKQAKAARQQAIQINIFTAVLCALRHCAESKKDLGSVDVRNSALILIMDMLASPSPLLRCAAGEALGRMTQCCDDNKFVADMVQKSFEKLQSSRDVVSRTGHSLALGCLHRYVGGMTSGQHLQSSVSILLALAKDHSAPVVQVWALHALGLIADSGGPMFRTYVEATLNLMLNSLLTVPPSHTDVHQCLGKCLAALITNLGPELQGTSSPIYDARLSCLISCAIMTDHPDSLVQAQAISCLQQLHLFAPRHVNLSSLVPRLCTSLTSPHLLLRRSAVACLRQLAQREANEICDYARTLYKPANEDERLVIAESGLEGALFGLLDRETDGQLRKDVRDTLTSMLQSLAGGNLSHWFQLVRNVLSAATDLASGDSEMRDFAVSAEDDEDGNEDDDEQFKGVQEKELKSHLAPKWPTRVFAVSCMMKLMQECKDNQAHLDLALARELKSKKDNSEDYLVLHLSELVRVAFIAATSDSDKLRLGGLELLQDVINTYSSVREPEFPEHVVLEQYQAQVSAALRPAFTSDTPSDVTAAACEVCSTWIRSGVARDLNDLRRVHQLLSTSLDKLKSDGRANKQLIYSETAGAMEKLAVLRAWAEVYIEAVSREKRKPTPAGTESLLDLVNPELRSLARLWIAILRDQALLSLSSEYQNRLPTDGGAFFTPETKDAVKGHYRSVWAACLHAATLYLKQEGFGVKLNTDAVTVQESIEISETDRFHLLLGVAMEALCSRTSAQSDDTILTCLKSVETLLSSKREAVISPAISREILAVLHRLMLTRDNASIRNLSIEVLQQLVLIAKTNTQCDDDVTPGASFVFSCLEVCLSLIVRHIPAINSTLVSSGIYQAAALKLSNEKEMNESVGAILSVLAELPALCSDNGRAAIMPILLYLVIGTIKEVSPVSRMDADMCPAVKTALKTLTVLCSPTAFHKDGEKHSPQSIELLQCAITYLLEAGKDSNGIPPLVLLYAVAIVAQSCPAQVVAACEIKEKIVATVTTIWSSCQSPKIRLAFVQMCSALFQHNDPLVSFTYIHSFTPLLCGHLSKAPTNHDITNQEVSQILTTLEVLLRLAAPDQRVGLMALFCSILSAYLLTGSSFPTATTHSKQLFEIALKTIISLGSAYPEQFQAVMSSAPRLKSAVEQAALLNKANAEAAQRKADELQQRKEKQSKPTIQLKMNFGNFK
ncbi:HEAT repeat-containing protein 5B-like isoform X2 [Watersipora subatra]|uniref:HEAT repeat-containing protein 5B-like isoform X2 n=1 Tax=Watersipora subatra TaxID=2589382 RepID=UPI00355AD0CA